MKRIFLTVGCVAALISGHATGAAAQSGVCLEFENVEQVNGTRYEGGTYQLDQNTTVKVSVEDHFAYNALSGQLQQLRDSAFMTVSNCFRGNASMRLTHVNLRFQIIQEEPDARVININYCERGPGENIGARVVQPPDYIGDTPKAHGKTIPSHTGSAVGLEVDFAQRTGGTDGKLIFNSNEHLTDVIYGGVELDVHAICIGGN